eukprot:Awhi_evm1s2236
MFLIGNKRGRKSKDNSFTNMTLDSFNGSGYNGDNNSFRSSKVMNVYGPLEKHDGLNFESHDHKFEPHIHNLEIHGHKSETYDHKSIAHKTGGGVIKSEKQRQGNHVKRQVLDNAITSTTTSDKKDDSNNGSSHLRLHIEKKYSTVECFEDRMKHNRGYFFQPQRQPNDSICNHNKIKEEEEDDKEKRLPFYEQYEKQQHQDYPHQHQQHQHQQQQPHQPQHSFQNCQINHINDYNNNDNSKGCPSSPRYHPFSSPRLTCYRSHINSFHPNSKHMHGREVFQQETCNNQNNNSNSSNLNQQPPVNKKYGYSQSPATFTYSPFPNNVQPKLTTPTTTVTTKTTSPLAPNILGPTLVPSYPWSTKSPDSKTSLSLLSTPIKWMHTTSQNYITPSSIKQEQQEKQQQQQQEQQEQKKISTSSPVPITSFWRPF